MNTGNHSLISPTSLNKIAHYRILRKLGQGGMSIVYEGLDERLKRPVAVKILHPFLAETSEHRLRFFREAEAVARLTHPNIVQIFDVAGADAKNEQLYIVTELLVGDTLKDFTKRIRIEEFPELSAMIVWEITHALEHAHQKGIIHRDIKPENIMICRDGQIKLMDFGIASLGNDESLTQSGTLLGSLSHLSPEVIKGHKATIVGDIFSLTTVFYWLLTKELPFAKDTPHALLKAIVDAPHQKVQCLSPFISDDLAEIVEKGLDKDPKTRFQSARAMGDAIENALLNMGISIDTKYMQEVLKNPEDKIIHFGRAIHEQIKKQIEIYQQQKNDAGALALICRLETTPSTKMDLPYKSSYLKKGMVFAGIVIAIAAVTMMASKLFFTHKDTPSQEFTKHERDDLPLDSHASLAMTTTSELLALPQSANALDQNPERGNILPVKASMQEVEIVIWPFATISIDGKTIARDKKSLKIKLEKGSHKLSFTHNFAATVDKVIHIDEIGEPILLNISLIKSKPAFLVIKTDIDADIAVNRAYKGSTKKSVAHPIVIPMPDKTHAVVKEVIVSQEGYRPFIAETEFIAGNIQEIEVKLTPLAHAQHGAILHE